MQAKWGILSVDDKKAQDIEGMCFRKDTVVAVVAEYAVSWETVGICSEVTAVRPCTGTLSHQPHVAPSELAGTRSLPLSSPKTTTSIQLTLKAVRHDEQCYLAQRLHVCISLLTPWPPLLRKFSLGVQQVHPNRRSCPPCLPQGGGARCRREAWPHNLEVPALGERPGWSSDVPRSPRRVRRGQEVGSRVVEGRVAFCSDNLDHPNPTFAITLRYPRSAASLFSSLLFGRMSAATEGSPKVIFLARFRPRRRRVGDDGRPSWSDVSMAFRPASPVPYSFCPFESDDVGILG
ncbi:hypothetical protein C8Q70DRAFT_43647 [Cubamyces menziesii]|nr:hypothetical protein C8Q70DRAFT_43647 [Cubamyces menziesii]